MVKISVKKTVGFKKPNLDNGALTRIGNEMVEAQKDRWSRGLNASGNVAKKLSKRYMFIKAAYRHTNRPIRDMQMTGDTIKNFALRKAIDNVIRAENTSREGRRRANRAVQYEDMIGFAGTDQIVVFKGAQREYGNWVKRAVVPIG